MKLRNILLAGLLIMVFAGMAMAADVIKIGVYEPMTGQMAFGGQLTVDGMKLAQEQAPEVLGKKIELIIVDNKSDKVEAANAVKRLIDKEKVVAIIGSYGSSLSMAGGEVAEKAGIPVITDSATNPLVTQGKKYYFRMCFIDPYQGAAAATYAYDNLEARKAALLVDVAQDYSVGLSKFFKDSFTKKGGEVLPLYKYQSGDQDFTAQLTDMISKGADFLFIPSYFAEGAIVMKQARELGFEGDIMGGDAMDNPDLVKIAGDSAEGFSFTTFPYAPEMPDMNPVAKKFTELWNAKYPDQLPNANSALGYDCYMFVRDMIEKAGSTDPEKITEAFASAKDWLGATGSTTINESHDAEKPVGIKTIKDGKQVYAASIKPEL